MQPSDKCFLGTRAPEIPLDTKFFSKKDFAIELTKDNLSDK